MDERGIKKVKACNLAVCQMVVSDDKAANLKKAEKMIREAVREENADLVVLPEIFNGPYDVAVMQDSAEDEDGPTCRMLSTLAKELGIIIIGGSIAEKSGDNLYNTSFTFNEEGIRLGRHRKLHLYDVDIPGGISFQESAVVMPGNEITVFDTSVGRLGIAICYDIRFPELIRLMVLQGAEIIIIPAAFNTITGPDHWHETIKIRAVDNQVYMVAASPARNHASTYHAFGHSKIVDPWGTVMAEIDEKEGIISAKLDPERLKKVRMELPLLKHRREDLYNLG